MCALNLLTTVHIKQRLNRFQDLGPPTILKAIRAHPSIKEIGVHFGSVSIPSIVMYAGAF